MFRLRHELPRNSSALLPNTRIPPTHATHPHRSLPPTPTSLSYLIRPTSDCARVGPACILLDRRPDRKRLERMSFTTDYSKRPPRTYIIERNDESRPTVTRHVASQCRASTDTDNNPPARSSMLLFNSAKDSSRQLDVGDQRMSCSS